MPESGVFGSPRKTDRSWSVAAPNRVGQSPVKVWSNSSVSPRPSRQNRIERSTSAVTIAVWWTAVTRWIPSVLGHVEFQFYLGEHLGEHGSAVWELGDDLAVGVAVVVVAVGEPDRVAHRLLDLAVVRVVDVAPDVDGLHPFALHVVQEAADELGLGLEDVDDRSDPVGVRAVEREQIRIARYDGAQIGLRPVAPVVAQSAAVGAVHVEAAQVVGGMKAGAVDDGVDLVLDTVGGAQTVFGELDDRRASPA